MYTIYASRNRQIIIVATASTWNTAIEIAAREIKYGCNDKVWIEGVDGEIYN